MRVRGSFAAWRFDNAIEGEEFGNYNFSHAIFFVKIANFVRSNGAKMTLNKDKMR
jgi:hypothetical protein